MSPTSVSSTPDIAGPSSSPSHPSAESTRIRRTQRPPKSCLQCSRRKIKCSLSVPCYQCLKKGQGHLCQREIVRVKGHVINASGPPVIDFESLQMENAQLRRQIKDMEEALKARSTGASVSEEEQSSPDIEDMGDRIDSLIKGLDFLSMGYSPLPDTNTSLDLTSSLTTSFRQITPHDMLRELLPGKRLTDALLEFTYTWTWWRSCGWHVPTFRRQVEEMWLTNGTQVTWGWVGLLLAVLSVGLFYMDMELSRSIGFTDDQNTNLPDMWVRAAVQCLTNANFLYHPSLMTVQTIAIMSDTLDALGHSCLRTCLISIAIRIAQGLNLHLLSQEALCSVVGMCLIHGTDAPHLQCTNEFIERETSRRVWLSLLVTEYHSGLAREKHGFPRAGDSLPLNINDVPTDHVVIVKPSSEITMVSHHLAWRQHAFIFHECITSSMALSDVTKADTKLQQLLESDALHASSSLLHVPWSRHAFVVNVHYRRLLLSRNLFARSFGDKRYEQIRVNCLEAARAIRDERSKRLPDMFQKTYGIMAAILAAASFIAIDLYHESANSPDISAKRSDVVELLNALNSGLQNNAYLKRASSLASWLLGQEDDFRAIYRKSNEDASIPTSKTDLEAPPISFLDYLGNMTSDVHAETSGDGILEDLERYFMTSDAPGL